MNFKKSFQQLLIDKPRYNLKQVNVENCNYADTAVKSKNCYYTFGAFYSEDLYYGRYSRQCNHCSGMTFCFKCDWCTECTDCVGCYMVDYSKDCQNCSECQFCTDCYGCKNCFGCSGLYQKQYCFFNEQLSKEEYEKRRAMINLQNPSHRKSILIKTEEVRKNTHLPALHHFRTEDCIGDHLSECKNCYQCYDSFALEDCQYNIETNGNKNCCDMTVCFESEFCYSCIHSPFNYNSNFLLQCDSCCDSEFCAYSKNLKNCFGCVYLENKEYYILNQPYAPEDYAKKIAEIKAQLVSNHDYNLLLYFASPYEAKRLSTETDSAIQNILPSHSFSQTFMSTIAPLICQNSSCHKNFIVISDEQKFYATKKLPLPEFCPACRHQQRMALRSERKLYSRTCSKCQQKILSTYPEEAPYQISCQKCFWENIG